MTVKVDSGKCDGCAKCVDVCPVDAIKIEKDKALVTEQCVDCESCLSVCPNAALSSGAV